VLDILRCRVVFWIASDVLAVRRLINSDVLDLHDGGPDLVQTSVVDGSEVLRDTQIDEEVLGERRVWKRTSARGRAKGKKGVDETS